MNALSSVVGSEYTAKCTISADTLEELKQKLEDEPDVIVYRGREFVPKLEPLMTRMLFCGAARYYMGRHTIAVSGFCRTVEQLLPQLDDSTISVLEWDIRSWLEENPTCMFGGIDDAEPWRDLLHSIESAKNEERK